MKKQWIETINNAWENRTLLNEENTQNTIHQIIEEVDKGRLRVAETENRNWKVNDWVKKAIILYFPIQKMETIEVGPLEFHDKMKLKSNYKELGVRVVPHAIARYGAYLSSGVIMMPSYVNIGAYVDSGTMVDTWATVGSCAQIGKNCHLSGGVGIGGVLEPLQANPVIIEDNCFVGARAEVAEGVIVREGSVLSMGVYLGASTKIVNRTTGEILYGEVPAYSVVVPGTMPNEDSSKPSLYCVVIVKTVDENTRKKTSINDLLRE